MERCRGCAGGQRGAMALTARGKVVPRALFAAIALVVRSLGSARSPQDHRGSPHDGAGAAARPLPLRLVLRGSGIARSGGHAALRGGGPDLTSISSAKSGWRSPLGAFPGGKSPRDTSYSGWGTEGGGAGAAGGAEGGAWGEEADEADGEDVDPTTRLADGLDRMTFLDAAGVTSPPRPPAQARRGTQAASRQRVGGRAPAAHCLRAAGTGRGGAATPLGD
jgi:hypothetical protein